MPAAKFFAYVAELLKLNPPVDRLVNNREDEKNRYQGGAEL